MQKGGMACPLGFWKKRVKPFIRQRRPNSGSHRQRLKNTSKALARDLGWIGMDLAGIISHPSLSLELPEANR